MLLHKMLRDIKNNLGQFISIFLMTILAALVFSGINAEWYGMKAESEKYYAESRLPDIWITGSNFNNDDVTRVKEISDISEATLRLSFDSSVNIGSEKTLRINVIENDTLSKAKLIEGISPDSSQDGLWLDNSFAKANDLCIGDKVTLRITDRRIEKEILGLIIHPEYVYSSNDGSGFMPDYENFGFVFLYSSQFSQGFETPYNQILITIKEDADEKSISEELESKFSDKSIMIINRDVHPSVSTFNSEIEQNKAMGGVFPVVFFLIAALSLFTTMTRMTNSQRTQIGILKALGFSKNRILMHYVSYGLWIGLIGGIIGLLTGPLIIPPILFSMQKTIYTLPNWYIVISPSSIIIAGLLALSCGASSHLACHSQLKDVPANCLRPKAPRIAGHSRLEKSKLWHRLGFAIQWNLRDIMRSRIRSLVVVIGITGCTALLLFGLGLKDSINSISSWMYKDLNIYQSKINLEENPSTESLTAMNKSYEGQWIQESSIELKSNDVKKQGSLTVLDSGEQIQFENENRRKILLPTEGIGISYKMAELLGIKAGDAIEWRIYGEKDWIESTVSAVYRTPIGQGIAINRNEYEHKGSTFMPTALLTSEIIGKDTNFEAIKSIQNKNDLIDGFNDLLESIRMIIFILVLAAIVLGSVVLYNLGALSFTERMRELATLRVLGFLPKKIYSLLQMQNVWLTLLGIIIGIPTGYYLTVFMFSTMPDSLDMVTDISVISIIISVLGTFGISVLINLILSRNIKDIDMVSALKSVD